jgi:hypothetical protein
MNAAADIAHVLGDARREGRSAARRCSFLAEGAVDMFDAALIERARFVPIEGEIARRGIRLRGTIERVGPCPVCGGRDRFSINTKKRVWNCRGA